MMRQSNATTAERSTGLPVDKYSLLALEMVARGQCSFEDQLPVLLKRQRERMLERTRLSRKKAVAKNDRSEAGVNCLSLPGPSRCCAPITAAAPPDAPQRSPA